MLFDDGNIEFYNSIDKLYLMLITSWPITDLHNNTGLAPIWIQYLIGASL